MSDLSIFVDESGDFGGYDPAVPFYIVSMVLHEQDDDIRPQMLRLDQDLVDKNLRVGTIHTRPLLRHERPYDALSLGEQRYLLGRLCIFAKRCPLSYKLFVFDRRECRQPEELERQLARAVADFVLERHDWLSSFSRVIVYYDDGQRRLSGILSRTLEEMLPNVDRRHLDAVDYRQYRLAQVADLVCCLELSERLYAAGRPTASELLVFGSRREFERSFYKGVRRRML